MPKKDSAALAVSPIVDALGAKVLPWAEDHERSRIIIATPTLETWAAANPGLPETVTVSPRRVRGQRVKFRTSAPAAQRIRLPGSMAERDVAKFGSDMVAEGLMLYHWPEDGTDSIRLPMLACIVGGRTDFAISDYSIHCPAGNFILIPPGVQHPSGLFPHVEPRQGDVNTCTILWLRPWGRAMRCWMCNSDATGHKPPRRDESCFIFASAANDCLNAVMAEAVDQSVNYIKICRGMLIVLLATVHRQVSLGQHFAATWDSSEFESLSGKGVARAQDYIRTNLQNPLSIEKVARVMNLSRSEFTRRFRRATGQSFTEYVTGCRMQVAKNLLAETDWPVQTIATFVGITPAHLRDIFPREVGMAPGEYRRSCQHALPGATATK